MEAGIVIKIAMVGIIVAVLSQVLSRAGRDDYALITVLAGISAVLIMLLPIIKTAALAVSVCVLCAVIKQYRPEYAPIVQIAAVAVIAASAVRILQNIISQLDFFSGMSETGGECISVLIKALGVRACGKGDDNRARPAADKVGGRTCKRTYKYLRDVYEMLESDCGSDDAVRTQYCRVLRS